MAQPQPPPDLILFNGRIVTVDASFSYAEAVAIRDGRFVAVGSNADVRRLAGAGTKETDLRGRTVVPGFGDNHLHSAGGGPGVDLSRARTLQQLLDAISERARRTAPGELIVTNSDWHEGQLKEQRLPLRRDLDAAAPKNPVVVVRGGHEYILNSAALERWKISKAAPQPDGGRIGALRRRRVERRAGRPREGGRQAPGSARAIIRAAARRSDRGYRKLSAAGLTTVRHPGGSIEQYRLIQEIRRRGQLDMRVVFLFRPAPPEPSGVKPDEGDAWLRVGGIKLGVDGGFEGGWMREPYAEPWGEGGTYRGLNTMPDATFHSRYAS